MEYKLPMVFVEDHIERDLLPRDKVVGYVGKHIVVDLDDEHLQGLWNDAEYYSELLGELGREYLGLVASARAVVRALEKQHANG